MPDDDGNDQNGNCCFSCLCALVKSEERPKLQFSNESTETREREILFFVVAIGLLFAFTFKEVQGREAGN
jgi:hypothetical protein